MDKLDLILEKLGNLDQNFSRMQKDIHMLDMRQSELNQMVSSIRDNQLAQRAEHDALVHDVSEMKGEIVSINKKLENTSSKLDQLVESQDRQDKILESLSLRSLEQETEIRDLKRIK
jgi:chromosome segregation ATPase